MYTSQALIPTLIQTKSNRLALNILSVIGGSLLLALLAQVSIPLPFTPVPITGQTFGVALLALCWGSRRAGASFTLYLAEGSVGLPFFAMGKSGLPFGPTGGYLIGMLVASLVVGFLADRGYARSTITAFFCCVVGSLITFACGLTVLSFFLPASAVLGAGLIPFLPGDLIKNTLAAVIASTASRQLTK